MTSDFRRGAQIGNGIALVLLVLALALAFAQQGSSAPVAAKGSIKSRVQAQTDNCTSQGGQIEVSYEYSKVFSGAVTSATTTCKGGTDDGYTCTNTSTTTDCSKPFVQPTQAPFGGLPDTADPNTGDGGVVPPSGTFTPFNPGSGNGVYLDPGSRGGGVTPTPPGTTPAPSPIAAEVTPVPFTPAR